MRRIEDIAWFLSRGRAAIPTRPSSAIALLVAAAAVSFGVRALRSELRVVFRDASPNVLSAPFRKQMETVMSGLPPGAPVLHVSDVSETWYSRMWERALYPRNAVVILQASELDAAHLRRVRELHGARFAISVGNSLPGTRYLWSVPLGPLPGSAEEARFGELAP